MLVAMELVPAGTGTPLVGTAGAVLSATALVVLVGGGGATRVSGAAFFLAQLPAKAMRPARAAVAETGTDSLVFFMVAAG
jgi:hypothetical protein